MQHLLNRRAALMLAAAAGLAGCERKNAGAAQQDGLTLGVLTPLTGEGAVYGDATKKGVDLALEEINAAGRLSGRPVRVVYEDDRIDPATGVSALQQLIASQHPAAVLGPFGSSVVLAVAPVANAAKVPIISASATADSIADAGDYVFRIVPANSRQGADDARYAIERLKARKAVIIFQNNEYGVTLRDAFARTFSTAGGQIVGQDGFDLGATDYRAALRKAKGAGPDIIFFPLHSQEATIFLRQAKEQGVKAGLISADGAMTQDLIKGAGAAAEGAYFSSLALGFGVADAQIQAFKRAYMTKYGPGEPDVYSAYYYEATKIVVAAAAGGASSEAIKAGLYALKGDKAYVGVTGRTSFDAKGEVDKPFYVYQVRNGGFELAGA